MMKRFWSILALSLLMVASDNIAWADNPSPVRRFALLVAANDGGQSRAKLRYAASDARALGDVLVQMGGVRRSDRLLVVDPDPSDLAASLSKMKKKVAQGNSKTKRTELLFYYSGHSDASGLLLGGQRVSYRELRDQLDAVPADVSVVILDSCSSGALTRTKGGQRIPAFLSDQANRVSGRAILTSSSQDEAAQESDAIKGSFFTHFLVSGLRGAADVSGDRRVTLNEAYRYAFDETLASTQRTRGGAQHAEYDIEMTGHGDLVLTALEQTNAVLRVDSRLSGRIWVRNQKRQLVAEVSKAPGRPLELGLPAGAYEVQLATQGNVYATSVALASGRQARVDADKLEMIGTEETVLRGDAAPQSRETIAFGIDLVPMVGTSSATPDAARLFSLNLAGGMSGGTDILEIGGAFNLDDGPVRGVQIGGALNLDGDSVAGVQIAGGANLNRGHTSGVQLAGGINAVGGLSGLQVAGGVNLGLGDVGGVQVAPVNFARSLGGLQLGVLNLSNTHVDGLQLGVVNLAPTADAGVGLLGIYWDGYVQPEAFGTADGLMMTGIRHGGGPFYNVYYVGGHPLGVGEEGPALAYGLGFGWHTPLSGRLEFSTDLLATTVVSDPSGWNDQFNIFTLRPLLSYEVLDGWAVYGGPTANLLLARSEVQVDPADFALFAPSKLSDEGADLTLAVWPGLAAGMRFF